MLNVTKELLRTSEDKVTNDGVSKSEKATLKMVSYCFLVLSFVYAVLLIILDFHPNVSPAVPLWLYHSHSLAFDHAIVSALNVPLSLLCPAQRDLSKLQRPAQVSSSPPQIFCNGNQYFFPLFSKWALSRILMDLSLSSLLYLIVTCIITLPGLQDSKN